MSQPTHMAVMTWTEIDATLRAGHRTVIVPIGSIEAHGPHLPTTTDCFVAEGLADRVATKLGGCLIAPTVNLGYAPRTNYPGTISVRPQVVFEVLRDIVRELAHMGASSIILLPAHAENFELVSLLAPALAQEFRSIQLIPFLEIATFMTVRNAVNERNGVSIVEGGWHAGASETAVMLALRPDLVRREAIQPGFIEPDYRARLPETLAAGYRALSAIGVMGDPTKARAEVGEQIVEALATAFVRIAEPCLALRAHPDRNRVVGPVR